MFPWVWTELEKYWTQAGDAWELKDDSLDLQMASEVWGQFCGANS